MILITEKTHGVILEIGEQLDYMENGYPRLIEKNIAFPDWSVNVYKDVKVPEEVQPHKYCYTDGKGFYVNEDYTEPEKLYTLDEAAAIIASEVNANV